jgi:hypothetical protein
MVRPSALATTLVPDLYERRFHIDGGALQQAIGGRNEPRADPATMDEASRAVADGASAREVIQRFGLFNADDFRQIHDLARDRARIHMSERLYY